ncbi:unnamed protein product [Nippostrongylus brasiliensis]|uniref:ORF2 n=1 Tax=Nippostrongylus brasiliensis TaxID=27835 RepID=A0A0N4Y630_NIPBR|nr:unnamed protein product [Nippostrongylus brasiliensis]
MENLMKTGGDSRYYGCVVVVGRGGPQSRQKKRIHKHNVRSDERRRRRRRRATARGKGDRRRPDDYETCLAHYTILITKNLHRNRISGNPPRRPPPLEVPPNYDDCLPR